MNDKQTDFPAFPCTEANYTDPSFNSPEFEGIRDKAGLNRFTMSAKAWIQKTGGIGLIAKSGWYGGGT